METLGLLSGAFILGLSSSAHCSLMCGPVQSAWLSATSAFSLGVYHVGRLLSYVLIALGFYSLGKAGIISLSASKGTLMLGISLIFGAMMYLAVEYLLPGSWTRPLLRLSSRAGRLPVVPRLFTFGAINGLLPCGMVWMAASLSSQLSSVLLLPVLMGAFLLGTMPALLGVGAFKNALVRWTLKYPNRGQFLPTKLRIPLLVFLLGIIFATRGYYFGDQLQSSGNQNDPSAVCLPIPN